MAYRYLSADDLVALQRWLGGCDDVDAERLNAIVARPLLAAHAENADLVRQAAVLVAGLACERPFARRNRQLALLAGDAFIVLNGFLLAADPTEFADQIVALPPAVGDATATLDTWLRRRIRFDG